MAKKAIVFTRRELEVYVKEMMRKWSKGVKGRGYIDFEDYVVGEFRLILDDEGVDMIIVNDRGKYIPLRNGAEFYYYLEEQDWLVL